MTHSYSIKGMTCNGCVAKVKSELLKLGNVESADIQLAFPQATISMNKHISLNDLQAAINKAGHYTIEENRHEMSSVDNSKVAAPAIETTSYLPIILIFGYISGVTLLPQLMNGNFDSMLWMRQFMAGFFIVFSFFKIMNLRGFAEGYSTYDIVAKRFYGWGFIYAFVELALGLAFLLNVLPLATNAVALFVMGISSIGVIDSLLKKRQIQCACLGTVFKLPLGKVTLFEDILMVVMSLVSVIILSK